MGCLFLILLLPTKYLPFVKLVLINLYRRANCQITVWRLMLPRSSKKGIGTLRETTGRYPSHVFVQNYSKSFVNKLCPIFRKTKF